MAALLLAHKAIGALRGVKHDFGDMMSKIRIGAAIALCTCFAFADSAMAAGHMGGMGGHMGGMGGHMGGMGARMGGMGNRMGGMQGNRGMGGFSGNRMAGYGGRYNRGGRGYGYAAGLGLAGFGLGYGLGGFGGYDDFGYNDYGYGYGGGYDPAYDGGVQYGYGDAPVQTGRSVAVDGRFCSTPVRSCKLSSPTAVGTPCSCVSNTNTAHGSVTP